MGTCTKGVIIKLGIAAGLLVITFATFGLLQHWKPYKYTLGLIAPNYEHLADGNIVKKRIPYTAFSNENFLHWDANHYKNIRDNSYKAKNEFGDACFAFFPLFPWIWKISEFNAMGIGLLNYLFFAVSLILLSATFLSPQVSREKELLLFALALILPGTIAYQIPYTEGVFILMFSLACYCLKHHQKWLFMLFMVLFAFTRPAITIILISFICTDLYFLFTGKTNFTKNGKVLLHIAPILLGTFLAMVVQHAYSGNWFKFMEVMSNWGYQNFRIPTKLVDWSEEGYGMSVFTLLGIFIPALYILITTFLKNFTVYKHNVTKLSDADEMKTYFYVLSLIYIVGITFFTLFFRGGSLNGLQRYATATPFFYVVFFSLSLKVEKWSVRKKMLMLTAILVGGLLFFLVNGYARGLDFSKVGFFLFLFSLCFIMFYDSLSSKKRLIFFCLLAGGLIIWKTYLLNMFLSNAWIYS